MEEASWVWVMGLRLVKNFLPISSHLFKNTCISHKTKAKRGRIELGVWQGSRLGPDGVVGMEGVIYLQNTWQHFGQGQSNVLRV